MDQNFKNLIRVGIVSSINPEKCTARVAFGDRSNVVSYELPILVRGSLKNKEYWMPDTDEQVVCIFLPSGNAQGFILGSLYSQKDVPPVVDENKRHISFSDGSTIEYDRSAHALTINAVGSVNIVAAKGVTITGKSYSQSW
jgi:phage baseplate assembly protein V